MSTRRPRVRAAAILKPRRPLASNEPNTEKSVPPNREADANEDEVETTIEESSPFDNKNELELSPTFNHSQELKANIKTNSIKDNVAKSPSGVNKSEINNSVSESVENKPPSTTNALKTVQSPNNSTAVLSPFRRISATPVNIENRRKSLVISDNRSGYGSPMYIKSPSHPFIRDAHLKESKSNASPVHTANTKLTNGDDEMFSPAPNDNDECFKSPPFMSPIYTRRIEPSMSPFHDIYGEDFTKSPSQLPNNTKIRQRIRPTPCFASRRNSIQGNSLGGASEPPEDEQHRRQRHYSISSNHSNYNPASTPQHQRNYFGLNKIPSRVRTESYSSSISDIPYSKNRRSHRSEEYQRVANAKREFNQRLNGKPPDKSRLTMYDLIYYNPLTNPMSKPAAKGDKNSDTASISSAKTNKSRTSDSVKSEASVKTEHLENVDAVTGPVPQLKLDANGEIILDEKSLVIETTGDKEAREMLANSDVVYDDEFSGTSGFYKRQKRTRDWLPLETLKFYRSLQTIGTDFSVMLQLFPNRSRRDLKLKFKKEEKHNMALINKALLHPKEFNVDELKLQFDKEDEEIEQKKQEWAEVRKKMATERREQLNASKKRNPNKQVSRSMRSLTDGDIVYEHEFVSLPPKTKRSRKRDTGDETGTMIKSTLDNAVFSPPSSINHNNNHVDSHAQHTYATHKLPRFIEMMSSQKRQQSSQSKSNQITSPGSSQNASINGPSHYDTYVNGHYQSNDTFTNDENSVHAIDLSTTSSSLVAHQNNHLIDVEQQQPQPNSVNNFQFANESTIGEYIAKNPNLTFKGSKDIMNMDIIFENVSIEEDTSIGSTTRSSNSSAEQQFIDDIETEPATVENVNIDGVHYQIITIENPSENDEIFDSSEHVVDAHEIPVLSHINPTSCTVDANESMANIEVAAEVEAIGIDKMIPEKDIVPPKEEPNLTNDKISTIIKDEKISPAAIQNSVNSANERKRKFKIVPHFANNKRTKKNQAKVSDTKKAQCKPTQEFVKHKTPIDSEPNENVKAHQIETETTEHVRLTSTIEQQSAEQTSSKCEIDNQIKEESITDNDMPERSFMDSLVVVESQDPNEPNRTIHEVFIVDPETNEMSDKPLELPDHVIQRIRLAIS